MRRRVPAEAYLGEIIGSTSSAVPVRRGPRVPDRVGGLTRHQLGAIGALLGTTIAIILAMFGPLRAAPGCALDTLSKAEAIAIATLLRADLHAARKEIAEPALALEAKAGLLRRLELRIRFADSIIACKGE